jgi:hypothetical protein
MLNELSELNWLGYLIVLKARPLLNHHRCSEWLVGMMMGFDVLLLLICSHIIISSLSIQQQLPIWIDNQTGADLYIQTIVGGHTLWLIPDTSNGDNVLFTQWNPHCIQAKLPCYSLPTPNFTLSKHQYTH